MSISICIWYCSKIHFYFDFHIIMQNIYGTSTVVAKGKLTRKTRTKKLGNVVHTDTHTHSDSHRHMNKKLNK